MRSKRIVLHDEEKLSKINPETAQIMQRYKIDMSMRNLSPKDFSETQDIAKSRLYSRISEMCLPLIVKGVDRRKANAADSDRELAELLGL